MTPTKLPAIFAGHGSPLNAIEDNPFSQGWQALSQALPRPEAILCISAHWETHGTGVTAMPQPRTIHDFYGFPPELYAKRYPAPGSLELARQVQQTVRSTQVALDEGWGLDHGAWSVLSRMYPAADIPVVQLSLDHDQPPAFHYALGQELRSLRRQGVLILGSGNMVHNLAVMAWQDEPYDWALEMDAKMARLILSKDHAALVDYPSLGPSAHLAISTNEHYLPLLYVLALQEDDDQVSFFNERVTLGSVSMRGVKITPA